jgi:hypothetical protein
MGSVVGFYNVNKDLIVDIDTSNINKFKLEKDLDDGSVLTRYAFRTVDDDGTPLTKIVEKDEWDKL